MVNLNLWNVPISLFAFVNLLSRLSALQFTPIHASIIQKHTSSQKVCPTDMHWSQILHYCTQCPLSSPIMKNGKCLGCPPQTHYQPYLEECIRCPDPQKMQYSQQINKCICRDLRQVFDGYTCKKLCEWDMFWNKQQQKCEPCPEYAPIYNGVKCDACKTGTFYLKQKYGCFACEQNMKYDENKKKCVCIDQDNSIESGQRCLCKGLLVWNANLKKCMKCPLEAPLFHEGICYACPDKSFYNIENNTCLKCPDSMVYDHDLKGCKCQQQSSIFNGKQCLTCQKNEICNKNSKKCEACLESTPLVVNGKCVECPENTHFDEKTKICSQCPDYYIWNSIKKQCGCPYNELYVQDQKFCVNCPENFSFNIKTYKCQPCPKQAPISINFECIPCPENAFFQEKLQKCIKCPSNLIYQPSTLKCICPANFPHYNGQKCQQNI